MGRHIRRFPSPRLLHIDHRRPHLCQRNRGPDPERVSTDKPLHTGFASPTLDRIPRPACRFVFHLTTHCCTMSACLARRPPLNRTFLPSHVCAASFIPRTSPLQPPFQRDRSSSAILHFPPFWLSEALRRGASAVRGMGYGLCSSLWRRSTVEYLNQNILNSQPCRPPPCATY